jgi:hypothetical protein
LPDMTWVLRQHVCASGSCPECLLIRECGKVSLLLQAQLWPCWPPWRSRLPGSAGDPSDSGGVPGSASNVLSNAEGWQCLRQRQQRYCLVPGTQAGTPGTRPGNREAGASSQHLARAGSGSSQIPAHAHFICPKAPKCHHSFAASSLPRIIEMLPLPCSHSRLHHAFASLSPQHWRPPPAGPPHPTGRPVLQPRLAAPWLHQQALSRAMCWHMLTWPR